MEAGGSHDEEEEGEGVVVGPHADAGVHPHAVVILPLHPGVAQSAIFSLVTISPGSSFQSATKAKAGQTTHHEKKVFQWGNYFRQVPEQSHQLNLVDVDEAQTEGEGNISKHFGTRPSSQKTPGAENVEEDGGNDGEDEQEVVKAGDSHQ